LFDCLAVLMRNRNMGDTPTATTNCALPLPLVAARSRDNSGSFSIIPPHGRLPDRSASLRATGQGVSPVAVAGYLLLPILSYL
jgi:hypothetical protein